MNAAVVQKHLVQSKMISGIKCFLHFEKFINERNMVGHSCLHSRCNSETRMNTAEIVIPECRATAVLRCDGFRLNAFASRVNLRIATGDSGATHFMF